MEIPTPLDTPALLPCPFCGSANDPGIFPEVYVSGDSGDDGYRAVCDFMRNGCGARTMWCATEADAVAAWNRRAPTQGAPQEGEALDTETRADFCYGAWKDARKMKPVLPEVNPNDHVHNLYREAKRLEGEIRKLRAQAEGRVS